MGCTTCPFQSHIWQNLLPLLGLKLGLNSNQWYTIFKSIIDIHKILNQRHWIWSFQKLPSSSHEDIFPNICYRNWISYFLLTISPDYQSSSFPMQHMLTNNWVSPNARSVGLPFLHSHAVYVPRHSCVCSQTFTCQLNLLLHNLIKYYKSLWIMSKKIKLLFLWKLSWMFWKDSINRNDSTNHSN